MPLYQLKRLSDNESIERFMTLLQFDAARQEDGTFLLEGERYVWDVQAHVSANGYRQDTPGNWPLYSEAFGCLPSQVEEFTKDCAEHGIPTEYTKDGRAIFRDDEHRKRFFKWQGKVDRRGFNY